MIYKKNMQGTSRQETEVYDFVHMLLPKKVVIRNDRKILDGRELDIYIPFRGVAIEFNGLFYHSDACRSDPYYHITKSIECEKRNIRLLQVMSDEWELKKAIVMDIIRKALGIYSKVDADDCELVEVSRKEGQIFMDTHHIGGDDAFTDVYLALQYNRNNVAMASFRRESDGWLLSRYTSRKDILVTDGCKAIVDEFRKGHLGTVHAECDRRYFTGIDFREAGFTEVQPTGPNVTYTKDFKSRIESESFEKLDEKHLKSKGIHKVYDCGTRRFVLD